jgi:hypothetical protein
VPVYRLLAPLIPEPPSGTPGPFRSRRRSGGGNLKRIAHSVFPHERRSIMPLITLIITLVVVCLILWLINNYIPMDSKIKTILNVVVVIVVIVWLLSVFGILGSMSSVRIG